jgi:exonuclease V
MATRDDLDSDYGSDIEITDELEELLQSYSTSISRTKTNNAASSSSRRVSTPPEAINESATISSTRLESSTRTTSPLRKTYDNEACKLARCPPTSVYLPPTLTPSSSKDMIHAREQVHILTNPQPAPTQGPINIILTTEDTPKISPELSQPPGLDPDAPAEASPYERFRSKKKYLSVSDLVGLVWCEQQYEYQLSVGWKTVTPEMARGTAVHKVLEEQVHTTVEVKPETKEDRWGLRLFNMRQGMRSLVTAGVTRELPIFGWFDDVFVFGVIDEVSYKNPHERITEVGLSDTTMKGENWVFSQTEGEIKVDYEAYQPATKGQREAYVSDTKTRRSRSFPTESQAHQTALQMMIYRQLLTDIWSGGLKFEELLKHFELDGEAKFSDGFIAQVAGLEIEEGFLEELLRNNNLRGMMQILQEEMKETIDSVGTEMGVSYLFQADGSVIGFKAIKYEENVLMEYMKESLKWWRGQRETVGVEIEDAWKCQRCEFSEDCTWRLEKLRHCTHSWKKTKYLDAKKAKHKKFAKAKNGRGAFNEFGPYTASYSPATLPSPKS